MRIERIQLEAAAQRGIISETQVGALWTFLDVSPQEVVPGQAEAADGCILVEASMGPVPVVAMQPWR